MERGKYHLLGWSSGFWWLASSSSSSSSSWPFAYLTSAHHLHGRLTIRSGGGGGGGFCFQVQSLEDISSGIDPSSIVIDACHGLSRSSPTPPLLPLQHLQDIIGDNYIISLGVPLGWDIEEEGDSTPTPHPTTHKQPNCLISLGLPRATTIHYDGIHYLVGKFMMHFNKLNKMGVPTIEGIDQFIRLSPQEVSTSSSSNDEHGYLRPGTTGKETFPIFGILFVHFGVMMMASLFLTPRWYPVFVMSFRVGHAGFYSAPCFRGSHKRY